MVVVILPDAQVSLLDLQEHMLERWPSELWKAAEEDTFAQIAQVVSGFITGPVVLLLASVGITDYRTVLRNVLHAAARRSAQGNAPCLVGAGGRT